MLLTVRRLFAWTFAFGSVSFAAGSFGPMVLAPGANQGPLLGVFITGPLGALVGFGTGVWRELRGLRAGPRCPGRRPAGFVRYGTGGACSGRGGRTDARYGRAPTWFRR